jgi:hypothetical protein
MFKVYEAARLSYRFPHALTISPTGKPGNKRQTTDGPLRDSSPEGMVTAVWYMLTGEVL